MHGLARLLQRDRGCYHAGTRSLGDEERGLHKEPPGDGKKIQKRRFQLTVWYLLVAALIVLAVQAYFARPQKELAYSEFRHYVRQGKIESARVSPEEITGRLAPDAVQAEGGGRAPRRYRVERGGLEDPDLIAFLEQHGVKEFAGEPPSVLTGVLLAWVLPLAILIGFWILLMRRMGGGAENVLQLGKSKAKIYAETDVKVTFKDVAGVDEAVEEVREIVEFLRDPDKFRRLGAKIPKGILLVGLPGTGKTLLARALAGESRVPFFHLSGSDFVEMFAGLGAARVRDLFRQAKEKAPCIVFIDELDALGRTRTIGGLSGHEEREQTLNALLVEMDGFEANTGVVLVGATNRPEILDKALLRPGRFDRQVVVDRPDQKGRLAILRVHSADKKLGPDVDLEVVAQRTVGMVGADLANVLNEAALLAGRHGREEIRMEDIDEAIDRVMAGLEKKKRLLSPKEREIVAYHEAGHALLAQLLPEADKVHKVSIVPRGVAALGYTVQLPTEDRYIVRRAELEDRLCVLFGGRAAEEVVFQEASTGAQNDLEVATQFARRMVTDFGMSERLGLVSLGNGVRPRFLEMPVEGPRPYSEETAREIDLEVKRILSAAYERARGLLCEHREALDRIANRLLEVEVIDRPELERLIAGEPPAGPAGGPAAPAQARAAAESGAAERAGTPGEGAAAPAGEPGRCASEAEAAGLERAGAEREGG
ncbi:MAG: ATP-dependent zinc metalloprotease FtsH [Planctomycetota bacterium]|nr:MAG: ATP-dependent zinc metalloprotease FtsH [Planctomycetota bacterium]